MTRSYPSDKPYKLHSLYTVYHDQNILKAFLSSDKILSNFLNSKDDNGLTKRLEEILKGLNEAIEEIRLLA